MTPLAARVYRNGLYERDGEDPFRTLLQDAQFLECTKLVPLAEEMVRADLDAGALDYSEFAQLPAPITAFEWMFGQGRGLVLALQKTEVIEYFFVSEARPDTVSFTAGFTPGTGVNVAPQWDADILHEWASRGGIRNVTDFGSQQASGINGLLEMFLCIINQPGLVEMAPRPTDKRILRQAKAAEVDCADKWFECRIRPGEQNAKGAKSDKNEPVMPLHYVRKYFKPTSSKWVDGYWRGDIALGLHLKWYSPQPPKVAP